jgi:hypothetical protein
MLDSFEDLVQRFPILPTVIKHLSCNEDFLRELFVSVYQTGFADGEAGKLVEPNSVAKLHRLPR